MATLHWDMRSVLPLLRDEGRLAVLTCLILHANVRNRCWPSIETIIDETGWKRDSVLAAKKWLADNGAIELVPYSMRINEEKALPRRQTVYQLTGYFNLLTDGEPIFIQYLYSPAESRPSRLLDPAESRPSRPNDSRPSRPKGSSIEDSKDSPPEKTRARDIVFDAVGHIVWGFPINASASELVLPPKKAGGKGQKAGGRIGTLASIIRGLLPEKTDEERVKILYSFRDDYKDRYEDMDLPNHEDSFTPYFSSYVARLTSGQQTENELEGGFTLVQRSPRPVNNGKGQ